MIEARLKGQSWKQIADQFNLPNPGAARKKFQQLTGIQDFQSKGPKLQALIDDMANASKDHTDSMVMHAVHNVDDAVKKPNLIDIPEPTEKGISAMMNETGLTHNQIQSIVDLHDTGKGYQYIVQQTGASYDQVDRVVWNQLVGEHNDIWQAYAAKPTSQTGFNAVQEMINDLRASGMSWEDINKYSDVPSGVVNAIRNGTWSMPGPGALKPIIPPPPPAPPSVYSGPLATGQNFPRRTHEEMMQWVRDLGQDMPDSVLNAMRTYTGGTYRQINDHLREIDIATGTHGTRLNNLINNIDQGFRPAPTNMQVNRRVSGAQQVFGTSDLHSLTGTTFEDKGFLSTSIQEGVWSGDVTLRISVPAGTPARYVQPFSNHPSEYEVMLPRNTPMVITRVEQKAGTYGNTWEVWMEVIP